MSTATDTALDRLRPSAGRISQGTAIEQSRAIAQVQAMVIVAQQCPRSVRTAIAAMEEACSQPALAGRAFFRFPRGKDANGKDIIVNGPSVHLARELARCWGNIEHGITELRRDDAAAESEMQAFAWDLETNTRSASIFIVPHKRDTKWGAKDLTEMRDIYENNANNGARRLRESIFSVLPVWYRERAIELCQQTNEKGGGIPLPQRIANAVKNFEGRFRVTPARMAAKFGYATVDELTAADVGQLGVIYDSLKQGTVTVDEEFPAEQSGLTAADILGQPKNVPPAPGSVPAAAPLAPPAEPAGGTSTPGERPSALASSGQVSIINRRFRELGYSGTPEDEAARLRAAARLARLTGALTSVKQLTQDQADQVKAELNAMTDGAALDARLAELAQEEASDG